MIQLSEQYRIVDDSNNVVLQFFQQRVKLKNDGTKEPYEFTEDFYYPTLKIALQSFVQKELKYSSSIDEVILRMNKIEATIKTLTNDKQ